MKHYYRTWKIHSLTWFCRIYSNLNRININIAPGVVSVKQKTKKQNRWAYSGRFSETWVFWLNEKALTWLSLWQSINSPFGVIRTGSYFCQMFTPVLTSKCSYYSKMQLKPLLKRTLKSTFSDKMHQEALWKRQWLNFHNSDHRVDTDIQNFVLRVFAITLDFERS